MRSSLNHLLTINLNDFKIIFRDRILWVIFFIPLLMIAVLIWMIPELLRNFPVLEEHYSLIIGVFSVVTAVTPAYVISFVMLDEKDEDILTVLRIMPLPANQFILCRLAFTIILGFFAALLILVASKSHYNLLYTIFLSLLASLMAPMVTLTVVIFAKNKIEGITFLKGINFFLILPVLSFFMDFPVDMVLALIPPYWTYYAYVEVDYFYAIIYMIIGFGFHISLIYYLYRKLKSILL